jgi:hypothetical protein
MQYNIHRGIPYTPPRGGLLTLIHKNYAYPNNIIKIPTTLDITPYLQILKLNNSPLTPIVILHLYIPSHLEDLHLIPIIMQTITSQRTRHPNNHIILCRDFNRDIALIGHTQGSNIILPQQ